MSFIQIKDVVKSYGDNTVLKNIHLEVDEGEMVTLLGPSGCGKSTLLRAIAGLIDINNGSVWLDGHDVTDVDVRKRQVGMVFQSYALFPNMTAAQNIAFGLKILKQPKDVINKKVEQMIVLVGLKGKERHRPSQLSGGQQQRVALARALIMEPKVLLLDEPLSALDAQIRQSLRVQIREIQQQMGITAIFVTHDQEEAMSISDRICVMNNGVIEQHGAPEEIYTNPRTEFVARFIGHYNVLTPSQAKQFLGESPGDCKVVAIRPEAFVLNDTGNSLKMTGKIIRFSMLGSIMRYGIDVNGIEVNVEFVNDGSYHRSVGEPLTVYLPKKDMLLIYE